MLDKLHELEDKYLLLLKELGKFRYALSGLIYQEECRVSDLRRAGLDTASLSVPGGQEAPACGAAIAGSRKGKPLPL